MTTIATSSELLDIYDANMNHIGTATREGAHSEGLWHKCFHCWLIMQDHGGYEYLLFQRRSATKKDFPCLLDTTAAGHLAAGEDVRDGIREVSEEIAACIRFENLTPLGIRMSVEQRPGFHNREFAHVYLGKCRFAGWEGFHLQEEEVDGLYGINIKDGLELFSGKRATVKAKGFSGPRAGKRLETIEIGVEDFVPRPIDGYYQKMFIAADLYLQEYPNLAIL